MRKTLLALIAATTLGLTGCASAHNTQDDPDTGFWATTSIGDVWCLRASSYSANTFDCQWSSLVAKGEHKDAREADGDYRYVIDSDGNEQKIFCISFVMRKGYRVINCNWEGIASGVAN